MQSSIPVFSLASEYYLRIFLPQIGRDMVLGPSDIRRMIISQSIDSLLPSFSLTIPSTDHQFIHLFPYEKQERMNLQLGLSAFDISSLNSYDFILTRRNSKVLADDTISIYGILDIDGLFDKVHTRSFRSTVSDSLMSVVSELKVASSNTDYPNTPILADISNSLKYSRKLLQCNVNNAQFLTDTARLIEDKDGNSGFFTFFYCRGNKVFFVFKSIQDFLSQTVSHKLYYGASEEAQKTLVDYHQIFAVEILDHLREVEINYPVAQNYCYFDYEKGSFVYKKGTLDTNALSLTKTIAIHKGYEGGISAVHYGRSNENAYSRTGYFSNRNKKNQLLSLLNLCEMKVLCAPLMNAVPGQLVLIYFATPFDMANKHNYQYQGIWMIQKVSHIITNSLYTELTLVRQGLEGSLNTSYVTANKYKTL